MRLTFPQLLLHAIPTFALPPSLFKFYSRAMRLLHAVLLSIAIVLALNVDLLQARALGDDSSDVSAGDVHPSYATDPNEENRFFSNFFARIKSFFSKSSSSSKTASQATKAQAAQRVDDIADVKSTEVSPNKIMDDWKAMDFEGVFKNDEELTRLSYAVIAQGRYGSSYKSGYDALVTRFELEDFAVMFRMIAKHGNADADKFGKEFLRKINSAWERQKKNNGIVPDALRGEYADVVAKLSKVV